MSYQTGRYRCTGCGACCRWPGYVRVNQNEVDRIAAYLDLSPREFIDRYTEVTDDRRGLSLVEAEDGSCIFLTPDNRCRIHAQKPRQCRDFPNRWNFPGFRTYCRARDTREE